MDKNKYAIVILAAGESKRLGHPKQLVKWKESTLLNHIINEAAKVKKIDVYVTLGNLYKEVRASFNQNVTTLYHSDWKEGMGSTISFSAKKLYNSGYEGIIFSVCDQPHISHQIFNNLIKTYELGLNTIITSKYKTTSGPPTLFSKIHLDELVKLNGDKGAKNIVNKNISQVSLVDFLYGHIDIDTEEDLSQIHKT